MATKINTKDLNIEHFQAWLLEQSEDVQKQAAELTVTAKADALKKKVEPLKTKLAKDWADIQKLATEIKGIDDSFTKPWDKNPQELYLAIRSVLSSGPKTLDELAAALPSYKKDKIQKRLNKGLTGKKTVFEDNQGKYSIKSKSAK